MARARRKLQSLTATTASSKRKKTLDLGLNDDEILDSDSDYEDGEDVENGQGGDDEGDGEDSDEEETVDARRIRLAKQYLAKLKKAEDEVSSDEQESEDEVDRRDRMSIKLQRERQKHEGTLRQNVACMAKRDVLKMYQNADVIENETMHGKALEAGCKKWIECGNATLLRGHDLTPTCVALQTDGERALSGSKDNSAILWDVEKEQKISYLCPMWKKGSREEPRSNGEVLSLACSDDGRFAAIGRRDASVSIYDLRTSKTVQTFKGHKGPVTSLAFRTQTNQLFSASQDRCIRHYNLDEMAYMETLYGHQAGVTAIDCHRRERPVSVGRDRTARVWKLAEDTHLIFRGGGKISSADCLAMMQDNWFVTGHDDGHLSLWLTDKKRAVATVENAHGMAGTVGRGIESIGALKGTDLAISGSSDGYLRLWDVKMGDTPEERGMTSVGQIPLYGFINDISVGPKARFCVVAVGQEASLGRWRRVPRAKNRFGIVKIRQRNTIQSDGGEGTQEKPPAEESLYEGGSDD